MKTAIITGASSGLGREIVRQLSDVFPEIGCCWLIARRRERLEEIAQSLPNLSVECLDLDLCSPTSFAVLKTRLEAERPEVTLLVNCAGCGFLGELGQGHTDQQTRMIDLNLRALTAVTDLVLPYMGQGGRILNVSSIASFCPTPRMTVYGATKAYVSSFTIGLGRSCAVGGSPSRRCAPVPCGRSSWTWAASPEIPGPLPCCLTVTRYGWPAVPCGQPGRGAASTRPGCFTSSTGCWPRWCR